MLCYKVISVFVYMKGDVVIVGVCIGCNDGVSRVCGVGIND